MSSGKWAGGGTATGGLDGYARASEGCGKQAPEIRTKEMNAWYLRVATAGSAYSSTADAPTFGVDVAVPELENSKSTSIAKSCNCVWHNT